MSRLRTGLRPEDWRDDGPSHALGARQGITGSIIVGQSGSSFLARGPASAETRAKVSAAAIARYAARKAVAE